MNYISFPHQEWTIAIHLCKKNSIFRTVFTLPFVKHKNNYSLFLNYIKYALLLLLLLMLLLFLYQFSIISVLVAEGMLHPFPMTVEQFYHLSQLPSHRHTKARWTLKFVMMAPISTTPQPQTVIHIYTV